MMAAAYAALSSLLNMIDGLHHHPFPPVSLDEQQVESLTISVTFLQEFLQGYNSHLAYSDEADPLESRIADVARVAEAAIESYVAHAILLGGSIHENLNSGEEVCSDEETLILVDHPLMGLGSGEEIEINCIHLYQDLQQVIEEMNLIKIEVTGMVGVQNQLLEIRNVSTRVDDGVHKSIMVGIDDVLLKIMDKLTAGRLNRQVIPIVGMGGIGKTTLARNIYAQPLIEEHFDVCAWATVSQQYHTKEILYQLLSQINNGSKEGSEDEVGLALYKHLSGRRYLIVVDDVWSTEPWNKIQRFFPDNNNSSRIVVTTRLLTLGSQLDKNCSLHEMKFLDEDSSWILFSKTVFGDNSFPPDLEEIGKKIVENCRGLPLSIAVTGGLLRRIERTQESWKSKMKNLTSMVNSDNDEGCLKILRMSYNHLPVYLKSCFLYMGVFEEDSSIRVSTLIKLWVAEGFLKPARGKSLETIGREYLEELVSRNLVQVHEWGSTGNIKCCKIHDLLWDLCRKVGQKERFYDVIGQYSPRCISSRHCGLIALTSDADLTQEKEYFPESVFQVVNLRYFHVHNPLMVRSRSFINLLWNLHALFISNVVSGNTVEIWKIPQLRHAVDRQGIGGTDTIEIWKMPQLRHVNEKSGIRLPEPPSIVSMENLQTLEMVEDFKCSEEMVKRIPNIKKLSITYTKYDIFCSDEDRYGLSNFECLRELQSLRCDFFSVNATGYRQKLNLPRSLKKLTLKFSTDFELEYVLKHIGSLPLLEKLDLTFGSFRTGKWEIVEGEFRSLKFLSLHSCEHLECWTLEGSSLPRLEKLVLMVIASLPLEIGGISTLKSVVLVDCNDSMVKSLKEIVEEQEDLQGELPFHVRVVTGSIDEALLGLATPNFQIQRPACTIM